MKKKNGDITVIITLYKTPKAKLINLIQYKNFKNILFEQESNFSSKKKLKIFILNLNIIHQKRILV